MMPERQLCIDIRIEGEKFQEIRERVKNRHPKSGRLILQEEGRRSNLVGGEVVFLEREVKKRISGRDLYVDGLIPVGVNASIWVSEKEAERLREDKRDFYIRIERTLE